MQMTQQAKRGHNSGGGDRMRALVEEEDLFAETTTVATVTTPLGESHEGQTPTSDEATGANCLRSWFELRRGKKENNQKGTRSAGSSSKSLYRYVTTY